MYEAFELQRLVEKLPLKICALATWGECCLWKWALNRTQTSVNIMTAINKHAGQWFAIHCFTVHCI